MALHIGRIISRYCIVTLLPAFVAYSIYADYSHTQRYKAQQLEELQS